MTTLAIKTFSVLIPSPPALNCLLVWSTPDIGSPQSLTQFITIGSPQDLTTMPYPTFTDIGTATAYYNTGNGPALLAMVNTFYASSVFSDYTIETVDTPVQALFNELAIVAETGAYSDLIGAPTNLSAFTNGPGFINAGALATALTSAFSSYSTTSAMNTAITTAINALVNGAPGALDTLKELADAINDDASYAATITTALGTKVSTTALATTLGSYSTTTAMNTAISAAITAAAPAALSFSNPTRTVGTSFRPSTTRNTLVNYSIPVSSVASVIAGSQASATLKYADDSGMTTNVVTLPTAQFGAASGLVVTSVGTLSLSGVIPAGKYAQITTANISGTPTYGSITAQEVLL